MQSPLHDGGSAFCTPSISQPFLPQPFPMPRLGPAPRSGFCLYFSGIGSQVQNFWALLKLWLRKVVLGRFTKVCEDQLFVLTHWHLVFRLVSELWRTVYLETLCGASGFCFHCAVKGTLGYLKLWCPECPLCPEDRARLGAVLCCRTTGSSSWTSALEGPSSPDETFSTGHQKKSLVQRSQMVSSATLIA